MGGKPKAQRTKNNARPSNSGRSAELLGNSNAAVLGFASLKDSKMYNNPSSNNFASDSTMNQDFLIVLKKMSKKDSVTKQKALQEFIDLCKVSELDVVKTVLPNWQRLYNTLALDDDHQVREAAQQAHKQIVVSVKRDIAPHLKQFIGTWFVSQFDANPVAATTAKSAFQDVFPPWKRTEAISFCQKEILKYISHNLIEETPETLCNNKSLSQDEMQIRYQRIITSNLLGYSAYIDKLPKEQLFSAKEENKQLLFNLNKFWKFAKEDRTVKAAWFSMVITLIEKAPYLLEDHYKKLCNALFGSLDENESTVLPLVWEALLSSTSIISNWWEYVNPEHVALPKLWKVLQNGAFGNAVVVYPHLLPLLSKFQIPPNVREDHFYNKFFANMAKGLDIIKVQKSSSESEAIVSCFFECLRYVLKMNSADYAFCYNIVSIHLVSLFSNAVNDATMFGSSASVFWHLSYLLRYWKKLSKDNENENRTVYAELYRITWQNVRLILTESIKSIDEEVIKKEDLEKRLKSHSKLISLLKNPGESRPKKQLKVKFASHPEEENKQSNLYPPNQKLDEDIKDDLKEMAKNAIEVYYEFMSDKSKYYYLYVNQLCNLLNSFNEKYYFRYLLSLATDEGPTKFIHRILNQWLKDSKVSVHAVLNVIFHLLVYLKDEEKVTVLENISEEHMTSVLELCLNMASDNQLQTAVKKWLSSNYFKNTLHSFALDLALQTPPSLEKLNVLKTCFRIYGNGMSYTNEEMKVDILLAVMQAFPMDFDHNAPNNPRKENILFIGQLVREIYSYGPFILNHYEIIITLVVRLFTFSCNEKIRIAINEHNGLNNASASTTVSTNEEDGSYKNAGNNYNSEDGGDLMDLDTVWIDGVHTLVRYMGDSRPLFMHISECFAWAAVNIMKLRNFRIAEVELIKRCLCLYIDSLTPKLSSDFQSLKDAQQDMKQHDKNDYVNRDQIIDENSHDAATYIKAENEDGIPNENHDSHIDDNKGENKEDTDNKIQHKEPRNNETEDKDETSCSNKNKKVGRKSKEKEHTSNRAKGKEQTSNKTKNKEQTSIINTKVGDSKTNCEPVKSVDRTNIKENAKIVEDHLKNKADIIENGNEQKDMFSNRLRKLACDTCLRITVKCCQNYIEPDIVSACLKAEYYHGTFLYRNPYFVQDAFRDEPIEEDESEYREEERELMLDINECLEDLMKLFNYAHFLVSLVERYVFNESCEDNIYLSYADADVEEVADQSDSDDSYHETDLGPLHLITAHILYLVIVLKSIHQHMKHVNYYHYLDGKRLKDLEYRVRRLVTHHEGDELLDVQFEVIRNVSLYGGFWAKVVVYLAYDLLESVDLSSDFNDLMHCGSIESPETIVDYSIHVKETFASVLSYNTKAFGTQDAKLDEERLSIITHYLKAHLDTDLSSEQQHDVWAWLDTILIQKKHLELTFNVDLYSCKPIEIILASTVCRFLSVIPYIKIDLITEKRMDFMMIALASWIQSINKTCENHMYEDDGLYNMPICIFISAVCDMIKSMTISPQKMREEHENNKLFIEWNNVFSNEAFAIILCCWETLAESTNLYNVEQFLVLETLSNLIISLSDFVKFSMKPDINHWISTCCNLIKSIYAPVRMAAYHILYQLADEMVSQDEPVPDECNKQLYIEMLPIAVLQAPITLFTSGKYDCLSKVQLYSNGFIHIHSYLLIWYIIDRMCEKASIELCFCYATWLKERSYLEVFLSNLYSLYPVALFRSVHSDAFVKKYKEKFATRPSFSIDESFDMFRLEHLACHIYYRLLWTCPLFVRFWWNSLEFKHAAAVDRMTTVFVSQALINDQLKAVKQFKYNDENFKIRVYQPTRQIVAIYAIEDTNMEITLNMSVNHPLGVTKVDGNSNLQLNGNWKTWMKSINLYITHQNGMIHDGLLAWKQNLDKTFDGVEECCICFSIVHSSNFELPKRTCKTCHKKFHGVCLYRWLITSGKSTCPICRNTF